MRNQNALLSKSKNVYNDIQQSKIFYWNVTPSHQKSKASSFIRGWETIYYAIRLCACTLWDPTTIFSHFLSFIHIKLYSYFNSYTVQIFPWIILFVGSLSTEQKVVNEATLILATDFIFHVYCLYYYFFYIIITH